MSVSEAKRVALLARPGEARERLRVALHEAGADIVLEDDPNTLDAETGRSGYELRTSTLRIHG